MLPYDFNRATEFTNSGVRPPRPPVYCNHYGIYVEPFDKLYHVGRDSNNLNVRGLRYSNFGVDCQMEVAFGFAVDTDGFMVVYTADYLL